MIKAVIFDLDGTLVNSLGDLAASTNYALKQFGFPTHETEKFRYFVGDGMPKLIERALPENRRDEATQKSILSVFMNHYREHYADNTTEYDGIKELLFALHKKGIKTAVVSNKADEMTKTVVEKIFGNSFCIIAGKKPGYAPKPNPELTLDTIKKLGVKPYECIFAGDSGMDAKTAVNTGCVAVGVLWGFRTENELRENGAEYIIKKPNELLVILEELNK